MLQLWKVVAFNSMHKRMKQGEEIQWEVGHLNDGMTDTGNNKNQAPNTCLHYSCTVI